MVQLSSEARAVGLSGLTSRPKTGKKVVELTRNRYNHTGNRPGSPPAVSSWADQDRFYPGQPKQELGRWLHKFRNRLTTGAILRRKEIEKMNKISLLAGTVALVVVISSVLFLVAGGMARGTRTGALAPGNSIESLASVAPAHNTVALSCPAEVEPVVCSFVVRITFEAGDGASYCALVPVAKGPPLAYSFTGLGGGGGALDALNVTLFPALNTGLPRDTITIPMPSLSTVRGGHLPATLTVPSRVGAVFTVNARFCPGIT